VVSKNKIDRLDGFAVITGASSGIGLELARRAGEDGAALLLVADRPLDEGVAAAQEAGASEVETLRTDLATEDGVDALIEAIGMRRVDALIANAGHGQGGTFLGTDWRSIKSILDTNVTGTISLIHQVGRRMLEANHGRILVTGSIVGAMPGPFNLIYNSTKAFIDDFVVGLAEELKDSAVTVSSLLPGATDTQFFERADLDAGGMGDAPKADPRKVARDGYQAMLDGETQEVSGFLNKLQFLAAGIIPDEIMAKVHRRMMEPAVEK
ncbi:SDR family NAD(P)-dependent oxidoreductase, partial [Sphingomicrobium sp. XHP0235]|uniref:SDR family NAD(P)-dependent oxidoreductase n=1 Tax=Sphingomicrobium aquimarinum TaxID=3133971 RepID=UPI0031FEAAA0